MGPLYALLLLAAILGFAAMVWLLDKPRRDFLDHLITRRPPLIIGQDGSWRCGYCGAVVVGSLLHTCPTVPTPTIRWRRFNETMVGG